MACTENVHVFQGGVWCACGNKRWDNCADVLARDVDRIPDAVPSVAEAVKVLESSRIEWRRDFDALFLGFILGVLVTLVVT